MVSVIIPSYNRATTIKKAVDSVLNQTMRDLEVIVVDDGSDDNTSVVIESIHDTRVRYVKQENLGACVARNTGIAEAKGEYIAFHDSDDIWHPDKLEKQMKVIEIQNADIVFCRLIKINDDETKEYKPDWEQEGFLNPIVSLFGIGTQTIIGKREVFEEFQFDKALPRFQEFDLLYRAVKKYSIYYLKEGLVDYYVGSDSISSDPRKVLIACKLLVSKYPELTKKYVVMGERMANFLLESGFEMKTKGQADISQYLKLALKCSHSPKVLIKSVMIWAGLFSIWKNIK